MPDRDPAPSMPHPLEVAEAEVEVKPPLRVLQLIRDKINAIRARSRAVRDVVRDEVNRTHAPPIGITGRTPERHDATIAQETLYYVLEGARQGKLITIVGDPTSPPPLAASVLREIGRRVDGAEVRVQSAPELLHFFDRLINEGVNDAHTLLDIFNDAQALKTIEPHIHRKIARVCQEIVVNQGLMTRADAQAAFVEESYRAGEALSHLEEAERDRVHPGRDRGVINLPHSARLSVAQQQELNVIERRIKDSGLHYDEYQKIFQNLFQAGLTESDRAVLRGPGIGMTSEEIARFEDLTRDLRASEVRGHEIEIYFRHGEQQLFSFESLQMMLESSGGVLTPDMRRQFRRHALRAVNRLLKGVDDHPDADFRDNYSDIRDGATFDAMKNLVREFADDPRVAALFGGQTTREYGEFRRFMTEGVVQEMARERELREVYHNIGIWIKTLPPGKIAELLARYNVSMITSQATSDMSGKLVDMALSAYERYMQADIAFRGNAVRPGLFSSGTDSERMIFTDEDRAQLRMRFKQMLVDLGPSAAAQIGVRAPVDSMVQYDPHAIGDVEEWEIDRALKYARGISLVTTARAYEIVASAQPPTDFKGSADNFFNMAGFFNPAWKVKFGKGGKIMHFDEILHTQADRRPKSLLRRIFSRGWNPERVHKEATSELAAQATRQWTKIEDSWLNRNQEFQKLMRIFNKSAGGMATLGGYRLEGLKTLYKERAKRSLDSDWTAAYEWFTQHVGAGARFWLDEKRAEGFAHYALFVHARKTPGRMTKTKREELIKRYSEGDHANEAVMTAPGGEKLTYLECMEARQNVLRGENFLALLRRSPVDFLNNLVQMVPELRDEALGGVSDKHFLFDRRRLKATSTEEEYETICAFQNRLVEVWGRQNIDHLRFVRNKLKEVVAWSQARGITDKDEIVRDFTSQCALAFERARLRGSPVVEVADIDDPQVANLLLGGDGLVTHFTALHEDFGNDTNALGEKGFFYHMGKGWYTEQGHSIHPNTADVDWRMVFKYQGREGGEDTGKRLWSGIEGYNEVIDSLRDLDHILWSVATTGDMKPLMELHQGLHKLEENLRTGGMYEVQYYISTIVSRFFQEHWTSRIPWPAGAILGMTRGKEISLSKILTDNRNAFSMNQDQINGYIESLRRINCLPKEGPFSAHNLQKSVGADWQKIVVTEIIPNGLPAILLFIFLSLMHASISDVTGGGGGGKRK